MKGTKNNKNKDTKKIQTDILYKIFCSIYENKKMMNNPMKTKIKCLKKKKQLFVSNLSDAIRDVDTREKNRPIKNKVIIKLKINLSKFFHH